MASIPRLVLAGTSSGVGKTTTTVALARALQRRGLRVALFKCGPDYLDPTYHARATGAPSHNLDGWMMGREAVTATFVRAASGTGGTGSPADIALIEGVMGLFDGASPTGEEGSTAQIAKWLGAPVALLVDASGMARSIAAMAQGFASFDPALDVAAVIANRIGSRGHLDLLRQALRAPPILGGFPKDEAHAFPERHLGLRTADQATLPDALLDHWAERAEAWLSIDLLLDVARRAADIAAPLAAPAPRDATTPARCRIGIAADEAFHFYYEDNLRRLEALGAELVRFSPVHDATLPDVDGLYLGGGYPEVHAAALASNASMRAAVAAFAERGGAIYAECGGLMYLTAGIRTLGGERFAMAGVLPGEAVMCERLQALGYVEVETQQPSPVGGAGVRFRGHQFRYSELLGMPDDFPRAYTVRRRRGDDVTREGYAWKNVLASYVHAHWASNPAVARAFVDACVATRGASR
jgi:cobyrinic acid a,c-diamide synthase